MKTKGSRFKIGLFIPINSSYKPLKERQQTRADMFEVSFTSLDMDVETVDIDAVRTGKINTNDIIKKINPDCIFYVIDPPISTTKEVFNKVARATEVKKREFVAASTDKANLDKLIAEEKYLIQTVALPNDMEKIPEIFFELKRKKEGQPRGKEREI